MQITGMLSGSRLLRYVGFPTAEVLGPEASTDDIKALIDKHGEVFIKPLFRGGVGKKGKAGLIGRASDVETALREKERLYFAEHRHGNAVAKAEGVTFEGAVPAEHEVYFAITDSTRFRAPTVTITHHGGMDIEELPKEKIAEVPFDPLTGLKAFVIANALTDLGAPDEIISPLVQNLPKLWDLFHNYGMTTLELNPIRMMPTRKGRLLPRERVQSLLDPGSPFPAAFDRRVHRQTGHGGIARHADHGDSILHPERQHRAVYVAPSDQGSDLCADTAADDRWPGNAVQKRYSETDQR